MGSAFNLRRKGARFYFRKKIPDTLRSRLGRVEIVRSLDTSDRRVAQVRARKLWLAVEGVLVNVRNDLTLSQARIDQALDGMMARMEWADEVRLAQNGSLFDWHGNPPPDADAIVMESMAYEYRTALAKNDFTPVNNEFAQILAKLGAGLTELDERLVARSLLRMMAESCERSAHHMRTDVYPYLGDSAPEHEEFGGEQESYSTPAPLWDHQGNTDGAAKAPASAMPGGASTKFDREAGPTFASQAPYVVGERVKARQVGPDAATNLAPSLRLWLQICGDTDIRTYTAEHMSEFRNVLVDIPKIYWRSEAEQSKTILQIIAEADAKDPEYVRVSPKTINKHISNINSIFEYGKAMGLIDKKLPSFAEGLYLETGSEVSGLEENEERPGYTREQVHIFFTHPVYTGRKSEYFYNDKGEVVIRDALYWLPLLAAFQLMRREEICQLKVKHVRQLGGIWFFDLMHHEIKLKRGSSRRRVPLHDAIIQLGFLEEVVEAREPDELLFPELVPSAKGSFSDGVGKRVGRMVDSLKIKLIRVDATEADGALHPFRHHGITQLENFHDVKGGIIDALSGHSSKDRKSERRRYTDEIYLTVLRDTINKLDIPADVNFLNRKWKDYGLGK